MIKEQIKYETKKRLKRKVIMWGIFFLKPLIIPIIFIIIIMILVCYITDIFYIGIKNEDKSNMKEEIKYYSLSSYTEEDTTSFFESVGNFISKIFGKEIVDDAEWPVIGSKTITSYYGYRESPTAGASSFHSGIDIAAPEGTKIIAVVEGKITNASWAGAGGYTITMISGEYTFTYCHCSPEFLVHPGENVEKGQVIGKVGPKNVYGVSGNPYKDSNGNPTNRCYDRMSLPFCNKEKWKIY